MTDTNTDIERACTVCGGRVSGHYYDDGKGLRHGYSQECIPHLRATIESLEAELADVKQGRDNGYKIIAELRAEVAALQQLQPALENMRVINESLRERLRTVFKAEWMVTCDWTSNDERDAMWRSVGIDPDTQPLSAITEDLNR